MSNCADEINFFITDLVYRGPMEDLKKEHRKLSQTLELYLSEISDRESESNDWKDEGNSQSSWNQKCYSKEENWRDCQRDRSEKIENNNGVTYLQTDTPIEIWNWKDRSETN